MVEMATIGYGAVLLASAGVVVASLRKIVATPRKERAEAAPDPDSKLIAVEVLNEEGRHAGETVRVQGEDVILKERTTEGLRFLLVPKDALAWEGDTLRASGVDWVLARNKGEQWRREHEDVMTFDKDGMPVAKP